MKRVCSWCGKDMGEKEPFEDKSVTSGMCPECYKKQTGEEMAMENKYAPPQAPKDPEKSIQELEMLKFKHGGFQRHVFWPSKEEILKRSSMTQSMRDRAFQNDKATSFNALWDKLDSKDRSAVLQEQGLVIKESKYITSSGCQQFMYDLRDMLKRDIQGEIKANGDYRERVSFLKGTELSTWASAIGHIANEEAQHKAILEIMVDVITEKCGSGDIPLSGVDKAQIKYDVSKPPFRIPTFRPPSSFLVEQAKIIEVQTKMAIKAEVLQYTRYGIVKVTLQLTTPYLKDYSKVILSIEHHIEGYPVTLEATLSNKKYECKDEEEFLSCVKVILTSNEVRRVISLLLSYVK